MMHSALTAPTQTHCQLSARWMCDTLRGYTMTTDRAIIASSYPTLCSQAAVSQKIGRENTQVNALAANGED